MAGVLVRWLSSYITGQVDNSSKSAAESPRVSL
jgi:hypothetical protein